MTRRATVLLTVAAVALLSLLGATASALVGRGSAGAPLSITFKNGNDTTNATVTIAADGTYKADFGISQPGDYTATIKRSNGRTLAAIPITVTQATEPCLTPTAGTGADWGVTHSPFPIDPKFPSFVTICGRVALGATDDSVTPAGSPPSLGTPGSVSRDDAGSSDDTGVLHGNPGDDDDDGGFPWFVVAVAVVGVGVVVALLWQHGRRRRAGSTVPDQSGDDTPE